MRASARFSFLTFFNFCGGEDAQIDSRACTNQDALAGFSWDFACGQPRKRACRIHSQIVLASSVLISPLVSCTVSPV